MSTPARKSVVIIPNHLNIRLRNDVWHMDIRMPEGWKYKTTGSTIKEEAYAIAVETYHQLKRLRKLIKQSFSTYANKWVDQIDLNPKPIHPAYKGILNNWILPFFRHMTVSEITEDTLREYEAWRNETRGVKLARDTVNNHHGIIRNILLIACKEGAMDRNRMPENFRQFNTGYVGEARPIFDEDEFDDLLEAMREWYDEKTAGKYHYKRKLLYCYVHFLYNTCIRPGEEVNTLKWRNIQMHWRHPIHKTEHVRIRVIKGKNKGRSVMARSALRPHLLELQELTGRSEPSDYVFCTEDGDPVRRMFDDFNRFLKRTDLQFDANNQARTLYSFRHMAITRLILEAQVPLSVIADNAGTSVAMIEKTYSKVAPEHFAAHFS